jgi:molybdopterin molybdotransferase
MSEAPYFITLDEALDISFQTSIEIGTESCTLDGAHNRILAVPLPSKVDDPPFDNSAMDGFAMRYEDTLNPPTKLEIIGTVSAAKQTNLLEVKTGQTVRIMTGAPLPSTCDSILQIELCEVDGGTLTIQEESKKHFVRKMGENLQKDKQILSSGTILTPARIGLCATMGYEKIPVVQKMKVAIISTGDELKQPGEELEYGQIYESNSYGLAALVRWLGHEPVRMHSVADTMEELRETLDVAAKQCDLILTSGGVSMGEWDLVRKIMEEEGDVHFWRVKIRPGSPPLFGKWKNTPLFGLPGNPVSSHVVFRMLVAPWIRKVTGAQGPTEIKTSAKLMTKIKSTNDCITLRRVSIETIDGKLIASNKIHQGSGNIASLAFSEGLTLLQPGQHPKIGDLIDVLIL